MKPREKNRWLIALSAVAMHVALGSIYSYSVWVTPLEALHDWSKTDITLAFSIAILLVGFSAAFLGARVQAMGPRKSGCLCGLLFTAGTLGAALSVQMGSLPLFLFFFGIVGGIGLGIGYITPVPTLMKWFPDKRGLATGLAITGFGFGSMIFGPVIAFLCQGVGVVQAFYFLALIYGLMLFGSSLYLAPPSPEWLAQWEDQGPGKKRKDLAQLTAKEALRTPRFAMIWILVFTSILCGISLISTASPMAQEQILLTELQAASLVGIMGLFNGLGRLFWASLSDRLGRPQTFIVLFLLQFLGFALLGQTSHPLVYQALVLLIIACFGGVFATLPALLGDLFGLVQLGAIHGYSLTAWGIAGLVGPTLFSRLRALSGSYDRALHLYAGCMLACLGLSLVLYQNIRRLQGLQAGAEDQGHA